MMVEAPKTESRKEQIYRVAITLFREKGYIASSMRDLAKELNIEAPSLYSHIKSKEEILQKVCFEMAETFFHGLNDIEKRNFSAKSRLEAAIHSHINVICEHKDAVAVFLNEWRHLSQPHYSDFVQLRNQYEEKFHTYIKFGVDKGEFRVADVNFAVLTILSSLNWTYNWYKESGKMKPEEIASNLSEILIKGIS